MKRVVAGAGDGGAISAGEGRAALLPRRGWRHMDWFWGLSAGSVTA